MIIRKYWLLPFVIVLSSVCLAQNRVTIPWSASLDLTFGQGKTNPGAPLPVGYSDFTYTTNPCPAAGFYTVVSGPACTDLALPQRDAPHFFINGIGAPGDTGHLMVVSFAPSSLPQIIFADTIRNLCSNTTWMFWANILNVGENRCGYPNLTFSATTISGVPIAAFPTGNIGGPGDRLTFYPGIFDHILGPRTPFYGGEFNLPPGVNDIIVKITVDPLVSNLPDCSHTVTLDNIILMPAAPNVNIAPPGNPDGTLTAGCFENVPIVLNVSFDSNYLVFGTPFSSPVNPVTLTKKYINPQVQWQQSTDGGFTWTDIAGKTGSSFSFQYTTPDTFYIRLRTAEVADFPNLNCNIVSNVVKIQIDSTPTSGYTFSSNSPVCTDGDLVFTFSDGAAFLTTGPNGFSDNSPKPHINNPSLADSGWYYAELSTFGGCKIKDSVYVRVMGPSATVSADTAICYGKAAQLKATGGVLYSWLPHTGLSAANIANPMASPLSTTSYEVKVTDQSGCSSRAYVTVILRDSILKAAISGTSIVCPKDIAMFTDTSQGTIVSWAWDFGNGQTSSNQKPPAQNYPAINTVNKYTIRLLVTDTAGCTDTAFHVIQSVNNCYIAVPNAFTPNNDGTNDYLYPLNAWKAKNISFTVYNRFGQMIFHTTDWAQKWDGTIHGNPQPAGVYIWMLKYTDGDTGKEIFEKGTTVLIR